MNISAQQYNDYGVITMSNLQKYNGVIPAFYACYDKEGNVDPTVVREFTQYLLDKGVTLIDSREGTTYQINK